MPDEMEKILSRVKQHEAAGYSHSHAFELAAFEARIGRDWPSGWENDLPAVIFGDFKPPNTPLIFESLGITVDAQKLESNVIRSAMTALQARVSLRDKTVESVKNAARRLNLLVGILSYSNNGAPIRWWSFVTSPTSGGIGYTLSDKEPALLLEIIDMLPPEARRHVEAALYWLREPCSMILEQQARPDQLAVFAGYWNAFECIVGAANILVPPVRLTRSEKNAQINARLAALNGSLDVSTVTAMYREIVDRGLREKASHAIRACTGSHADSFIAEAFNYDPPECGLYAIRNAINHGTVDVNDPETVMLIDSRFTKLFYLVRVMLNGVLSINALQQAGVSCNETS